MRPILTLCAFALAFIALTSTAEARRGGSGANGAGSAPAEVFSAHLKGQPRAPAGGVTIDGNFYPGGQFIPAPKANQDAACEGDACEGRQPVRRVGKAVGRKLLAPVRFLRSGCRGGRCG